MYNDKYNDTCYVKYKYILVYSSFGNKIWQSVQRALFTSTTTGETVYDTDNEKFNFSFRKCRTDFRV